MRVVSFGKREKKNDFWQKKSDTIQDKLLTNPKKRPMPAAMHQVGLICRFDYYYLLSIAVTVEREYQKQPQAQAWRKTLAGINVIDRHRNLNNHKNQQNNKTMKIRHVVLNVISIAFFVIFTSPKLSGQNIYSLNLAKESLHFDYYCTNGDIQVLDSLAITLENNYSRITNQLGIQIDKKIKVKVFPNIQAFHAAINLPDAPDWVVGGTWNTDEIVMVSPLHPGSVHTYESLMQVIVHEFTHIAVYYARGDKGVTGLPRWLNEGYAQYEAGQINEHIRKIVESSVIATTPPTWTQLDTVSDMEFGNMNGYGLSVTIVEFLIATYGIDKLVLLIKEPENIEIIYGLPINTLEKQWIHYLKHEHPE